jgi:hypothetical protein
VVPLDPSSCSSNGQGEQERDRRVPLLGAQGESVFQAECHGLNVIGVPERSTQAFSQLHGHVDDSMSVAPDSHQSEQLNGPGSAHGIS